ncbi:MAG TPA: L-iditol 2-dehydrogenase [Verrucomicrobia bacterium]|nr:MAG: L-iditol 2-dehydrogenase [Lentisphaerae bacterium GWF2_57_35]HBA83713.1 L-iditol 2-dehydrogenase [Verrucomicrobiota bacterium]
MKAMEISEPGRIRLVETDVPKPASGEVVIRLSGCGLCASNIPVWEGRDWFRYPIEPGSPGHEGWGTIAEVGPDVEVLKAGDRVAVLSSHAYAEFDKARASEAIPLPDDLADDIFLGEPLACAMNAFARSDILKGQFVAVVGIGFLGALFVQLAKNAGAQVYAFSRRETAQQMALQCGADLVMALDDHESILQRVREMTNGKLCARVIEVTGLQRPLELAGELTAERGRLIIAGYHQDGLRQVNMQLWNWRGLDVVNAHERDPQVYMEGMKAAIAAVRNGTLRPAFLYTHRFFMEELPEAFQMLAERPVGYLKGVMQCIS